MHCAELLLVLLGYVGQCTKSAPPRIWPPPLQVTCSNPQRHVYQKHDSERSLSCVWDGQVDLKYSRMPEGTPEIERREPDPQLSPPPPSPPPRCQWYQGTSLVMQTNEWSGQLVLSKGPDGERSYSPWTLIRIVMQCASALCGQPPCAHHNFSIEISRQDVHLFLLSPQSLPLWEWQPVTFGWCARLKSSLWSYRLKSEGGTPAERLIPSNQHSEPFASTQGLRAPLLRVCEDYYQYHVTVRYPQRGFYTVLLHLEHGPPLSLSLSIQVQPALLHVFSAASGLLSRTRRPLALSWSLQPLSSSIAAYTLEDLQGLEEWSLSHRYNPFALQSNFCAPSFSQASGKKVISRIYFRTNKAFSEKLRGHFNFSNDTLIFQGSGAAPISIRLNPQKIKVGTYIFSQEHGLLYSTQEGSGPSSLHQLFFQQVTLSTLIAIEFVKTQGFQFSMHLYLNRKESFFKSLGMNTSGVVLHLPRNALLCGFYRVNLTMSVYLPEENITFIQSDSVFLQILESGLRAVIAGGLFRIVGISDQWSLDGSISSDPDSTEPLEGILFHWFCSKRELDYSAMKLSPGQKCHPRQHDLSWTRSKEPVQVVEGKTLQENTTYYFKLVTTKQNQSAHAFQAVHILAGSGPVLRIACLENCEKAIKATERLILYGKCLNCGKDRLVYFWSLLSADSKELYFDWASKTTTGRTSPYLHVNSLAFGSMAGQLYILKLKVTMTVLFRYSQDKPSDDKDDMVPDYSPSSSETSEEDDESSSSSTSDEEDEAKAGGSSANVPEKEPLKISTKKKLIMLIKVFTRKPQFAWWWRYVAWVIVFFMSFISSVFIILYGLTYGYSASTEWFIASMTSFFESVFLLQTLKMVLISGVSTISLKYCKNISWISAEQYQKMKLLRVNIDPRDVRKIHHELMRIRQSREYEPLEEDEVVILRKKVVSQIDQLYRMVAGILGFLLVLKPYRYFRFLYKVRLAEQTMSAVFPVFLHLTGLAILLFCTFVSFGILPFLWPLLSLSCWPGGCSSTLAAQLHLMPPPLSVTCAKPENRVYQQQDHPFQVSCLWDRYVVLHYSKAPGRNPQGGGAESPVPPLCHWYRDAILANQTTTWTGELMLGPGLPQEGPHPPWASTQISVQCTSVSCLAPLCLYHNLSIEVVGQDIHLFLLQPHLLPILEWQPVRLGWCARLKSSAWRYHFKSHGGHPEDLLIPTNQHNETLLLSDYPSAELYQLCMSYYSYHLTVQYPLRGSYIASISYQPGPQSSLSLDFFVEPALLFVFRVTSQLQRRSQGALSLSWKLQQLSPEIVAYQLLDTQGYPEWSHSYDYNPFGLHSHFCTVPISHQAKETVVASVYFHTSQRVAERGNLTNGLAENASLCYVLYQQAGLSYLITVKFVRLQLFRFSLDIYLNRKEALFQSLGEKEMDIYVFNSTSPDKSLAYVIWFIPVQHPLLQCLTFTWYCSKQKADYISMTLSESGKCRPDQADLKWTASSEAVQTVLPQTLQEKAAYYFLLVVHKGRRQAQAEQRVHGHNNSGRLDLALFTADCLYLDDVQTHWRQDTCHLGPQTTWQKLHCVCTGKRRPVRTVDPPTGRTSTGNITFLAGKLTVYPDPTEMRKIQLAQIQKNPVTILTVVFIFLTYIMLAIWAMRKDKADVESKAHTIVLPDNDPFDKVCYLVTIYTGSRVGAGTTATVFIQLIGDQAVSDVHCLSHPEHVPFLRGSINTFLLTTKNDLGEIYCLQAWHDNAGSSPNWFLSRVKVENMYTKQSWMFMCRKWFALDKDNGLIERVFVAVQPLAPLKKMDFFLISLAKDLADNHLWFSLFARVCTGSFNRLQRLSCCLATVFCILLINMMFFKADEDQQMHPGQLQYLRFLIIGVQSAFISVPLQMIITALFKYSQKEPSDRKATETQQKVCSNLTAGNLRNWKELLQKCYLLETASKFPGPGFPDSSFSGASNPPNLAEQKNVRWRQRTKIRYNCTIPEGDANIISTEEEEASQVGHTNINFNNNCAEKEAGHQTRPPNTPSMLFFKRPQSISWWNRYASWMLVLVISAASSFSIILYGASQDYETSLEWLAASAISLLVSMFFLQTLNVLFFSALKSLHPNSSESIPWSIKETFLEIKLNGPSMNADDMRELHYDLVRMRGTKQYQPLEEDEVTIFKKREKIRHQAFVFLKDVICHFVFLILILNIAYSMENTTSFYYNQDMNSKLSEGLFEVSKIKEIYLWLKEVFLQLIHNDLKPTFLPETWSKILGLPKMRQIRAKHTKKECFYPHSFVNKFVISKSHCLHKYGADEEDQSDYLGSWKNPVNKSTLNHFGNFTGFTYHTVRDPWRYNSYGEQNVYEAGGYAFNFYPEETLSESVKGLESLEESNWLDENSWVLIVEMTTFNPDMDLFCSISVIFELSHLGPINTTLWIHSYKLPIFKQLEQREKFVFILVGYMLVFYIIDEFCVVEQQRLNYLKNVSNLINFGIKAVCCFFLLQLAFKFKLASSLIDLYLRQPNEFIPFHKVSFVDKTLRVTLGFLAFLIVLKTLRYSRFFYDVRLAQRSILAALPGICSMALVVAVYFFVYMAFGYLVFGQYEWNYNRMSHSAQTVFSYCVSAFKDTAFTSNRALGGLFLATFMMVMICVLINLFQAVIMSAYEDMKQPVYEEPSDEAEVVNFLFHKIRRIWAFVTFRPVSTTDTELFNRVLFGLPERKTTHHLGLKARKINGRKMVYLVI
ncbi:polycystic kidney disease and receptor for egg jelly-related protein [Crotalus adamanteus]|uniref:Polycystin family receptor for egg jelly n=1 Tax=Crotalus adamanteus TaxID=8729 RepID=A0AAW1BB53_CROAD